MPLFTIILGVLWLSASWLSAQQLVAPTDPLTPREQQQKFHLPPGFEIQLVASEPDVNKPMNLKFDARGRLWVSHSREYPFPAKSDDEARDAITIFSELDANGRAQKVQRFAEHLNIPIGILPLDDANCLAWSIPNIYHLRDANGDGVADEKAIAYGPFGVIDTHGNQNGFTRWLDGWVYANHGFNNHSQVKLGGEGEVVLEMQSGNTYRFRADGSRIEQVAWGQVNPFGLCFDPLGNLFTADCHSRPVTMVLREGYYQSFGKPHDGLGYAPETTTIDHGGTGIAGVVYYDADQFPPPFRDVLFVGNVITNRIHCDRLTWTGSSPRVDRVEDFLTCDDPWFRPVDIQLGPDGALYVLDFYNKIIGHYEVPLTHPERDRERGRVWRIVYRGERETAQLTAMPDLRAANAQTLVDLLGHVNLTVRLLATNALVDRFPQQAAALATVAASDSTNAARRAHALWVLFRTQSLTEVLARKLAGDSDRLVRTHLMQALGEQAAWESWQYAVVRSELADHDPFVQRSAAEALAKHITAENLPALLSALRKADRADEQLVHALRISVRDQLRSEDAAAVIAKLKLEPEDYRQVLDIAAATPNGPAALLIYEAALGGEVDSALLIRALPAAAAFVDPPRVEKLVEFVGQRFAQDEASQLQLLRAIHERLAQRGLASDKLHQRLTILIRHALTSDDIAVWENVPLAGEAASASPWVPQTREYQDGAKDIPVMSSLPKPGAPSEQLTGRLRSPKFKIPEQLSFWMCGHNGFPAQADSHQNYARLVLADGTEVARSYPPRNDVAQPFTWDLHAHAGQDGYVEVVDADTGDAYAWLAVSRFEPPVIRIPNAPIGDASGSKADLVRLIGSLKLEPLADDAVALAGRVEEDAAIRIAACESLASLRPARAIAPLKSLAADPHTALAARQQAVELLGRIDRDDARAALVAQLQTSPEPVQVTIATALAGQKPTAEQLLSEIRAGHASAALLREPTVVARLQAAGIDQLDKQIAELTSRLSPTDDRIARLIKARREQFLAGHYDAARGQAYFAKSACAQCHKIGETGATIAPALNGIGVRGLDRLLEDIFDPNRNVDQAFRLQTVVTADGQVVSGFGVREEGASLVLHDQTGKQQRVPLAEIEERSTSPLSPMPANLSDQVPEEEFYHLLAYLLKQQTPPSEPPK